MLYSHNDDNTPHYTQLSVELRRLIQHRQHRHNVRYRPLRRCVNSTFHDDDFCEARLQLQLYSGCLQLTADNCR